MSISIQCPDCHVSLKANKAPPPTKQLECVHCGYRFTFKEATRPHVAVAIPIAPPLTANYGSTMVWRVALGGAVAAALTMAGLVGIYQATRPAVAPPIPEAPTEEKAPEPKQIAKAEPKAEPKVEPKIEVEPKVEPKTDLKTESELFKLLVEGGISLKSKQFDEAVDAYSRALRIAPNNADVRAKLAEARAGQEVQAKAKRDADQVKEDAATFLKHGQTAMEKKKFAAAIEFFKLALQKAPANEDAVNALVLAQEGMQKDEAEKKKNADFDRHLLAGKAALKAGKSADAVREFMSATKLIPDDQTASDLLKDAEKQAGPAVNNNNNNNNNAGDDRKKQFQNLIDRANNALRQRNLEDAEEAFRQALKISPADPVARAGLEQTEKALKQGRGDVNRLLAQARDAVVAQQLPVAMNLLQEAQRLMPTNPDLVRALRAAEMIQNNQATYFAAMNQAAFAMTQHLYGDAIVYYTTALQIVPNDPFSLYGLVEAQRRLEIQNLRVREYDLLVNQGVQLLRNQRYADARDSFGAALRIARVPALADPRVQSLFAYSDDMVKGNASLAARQFLQAGQFFQAALREIPNDPAAFLGLQKAQFGNKGRPIP